MACVSKPMPLYLLSGTNVNRHSRGANTSPKKVLSVQGCSEKTNIVRFQGRDFVDVQELARVTDGSLSFNGDGLVLTLPACQPSEWGVADAGKTGFSRPFMKAAIEAMGSIREWGGLRQATVQDRYPVGTSMTGNTIIAYQERAADSVALASAAASTTPTTAASSC